MASGKLSPRQKMINLMYLVLTALLALNVSAEILDAFELVDEGIKNSTTAVQKKVDILNESLDKEAEKNPEIGAPLEAASDELTTLVNDLVVYLEDVKHEVIMASGGYANEATTKEEGDRPKSRSNYDGPSNLIAEGDLGEEMKTKINETRAAILDIIEEEDANAVSSFESSLNLEANDYPDEAEPSKRKWQFKNFYHVPIAGTVTIIDKYINDAKNDQATVTEWLLSRVGAVQVKIDKLAAQVMAESSYIPSGGEYKAKIFLAASSSNLNGTVYIGSVDWAAFEEDTASDGYQPYVGEGKDDLPFTGDYQEKEMSGGMYEYSGSSGVGSHTVTGVIQIPKPGMEGKFDVYPFKSEYEVAAPAGFSISATKMNVLYIGLDNPLSITIGDAKPGSISASMTNGSLSPQGNGKYIARPSSPGDATVTANGVNAAGASTGGSFDFRVMRVPDPKPTLGGKLTGGKIQKGTLRAQTGVVALLEGFAFDARFNVVSYDFILSSKGEIFRQQIGGPLLNQQAKSLIDRAEGGDLCIIDNIKVKGPDGTTRKLGSITFEVL